MSTTEHVWSALRDDLIHRWADKPSGPLEQRLLDVFERHPQLVLDASEQIADRFERGVIRSPWPVFAKHVEDAASTAERANKPAKGEQERARKRTRAEQWVRATGIHFDREEEVHDELFGSFGMLRSYVDDAQLVEEMLALWRSQRPRGVQVEREAEERMRTQGEYYARRQELERASRKLPLDELPAVGIANPFIEGDA